MAAKILGWMFSKSFKVFGDEVTAILNSVSSVFFTYTRDKKQSEKIMKTVIKIGIELRSLPIQDDDSKSKNFECQLRWIFGEIDKAYGNYDDDSSKDLTTALSRCKNSLQEMVQPHLKKNSKCLERIGQVFEFISNPTFLDSVFQLPEFQEEMDGITSVLRDVLNEWE